MTKRRRYNEALAGGLVGEVRWHASLFRNTGVAALLLCLIGTSHAASTEPPILTTEIAGTVTSVHGAEAGV